MNYNYKLGYNIYEVLYQPEEEPEIPKPPIYLYSPIIGVKRKRYCDEAHKDFSRMSYKNIVDKKILYEKSIKNNNIENHIINLVKNIRPMTKIKNIQLSNSMT